MERTGSAIGATLARQQMNVTGKGVGVAVIDSGITNWHDDLYARRQIRARRALQGLHRNGTSVWSNDVRPTTTATARTSPASSRAAGYDSERQAHGHRAGREAGRPEGPRRRRSRLHQRRHRGDRLRDLRQGAHTTSASSTCRSPRACSSRTGSIPLTLAAKRAVDAGIVVVAAAGNLGQNTQGQTQYGGITSPGNAPWVLTVGASSHRGDAASAATTRLRSSARAVRRGSTSRPSRTSSRLASASSRWRIRTARSTPRCPRCSCRARLSSTSRSSRT